MREAKREIRGWKHLKFNTEKEREEKRSKIIR